MLPDPYAELRRVCANCERLDPRTLEERFTAWCPFAEKALTEASRGGRLSRRRAKKRLYARMAAQLMAFSVVRPPNGSIEIHGLAGRRNTIRLTRLEAATLAEILTDLPSR